MHNDSTTTLQIADPRLDPSREIHAPRGSVRTCKSWLTEAAYRMIQNNLDPAVAENPKHLVVYGGIGRAARDWACFDKILESLKELNDDETLLIQSGKPVGVFKHARGRAARVDRQFQPGAEMGELGAFQRTRPQGPVHVRPNDCRLVDLHRQPGHRARHLRNLRRSRPPALQRRSGPGAGF